MRHTRWFMGKIKTLHFIGIGGIGMSGLAEILLNLGFQVQGSDIRSTPITRHLEQIGARCFVGHHEAQIDGADVVIFSSAVPDRNPEMLAARRRGIPIIRRAELLAEMMRLEYGIAIAGTHGKTTTTSIIAQLLEAAGFHPTVVVGGNANNIGANAKIGDGRFFVAEADESDESFLLLSPVIAVVTNIDEEHRDHYDSLDHIRATFKKFLQKVPFFGCAVVCGDDDNIQILIKNFERPTLTYGFKPENDLRIAVVDSQHGRQTFDLTLNNRPLGTFELAAPGRHMILNATAAIAVGLELGADIDKLKNALARYTGVKRRLEYKGKTPDGIEIYDDYGHHPTEIRATLSAVRELLDDRPFTVVFQPHRYSRTRYFMNDFAQALSDLSDLILLPVYAASEDPIPGATATALAEAVRRAGGINVRVVPDIDTAVDLLKTKLRSGDTLLTLGAGDVFKVGEKFLRSHANQP